MFRTGISARYLFLLLSLLLNAVLLFRFSIVYSKSCEQDSLHPDSAGGPISFAADPSSSNTDRTSNAASLQSRMVVFIGGVPRSGTTLVRAMLDAHPDIRCGEETRVLPRIISMRSRWDRSDKERNRLLEAGLTRDVLDSATRAFISQIILGHGSPAKYLCNKDPLVLNYMHDVQRLYPRSKFVMMIRDGRAVAYSIVSRNITISGVDSKNFMSAALFWNKVMTRMTHDCSVLGRKVCLSVHYEQLVENPQEWMTRTLSFLNIPWHDNVLHHQEFINKEIRLSKLEPSSNQVKQAVNTAAVEKWKTKIPLDIQRSMYKECDMLKELGYAPT